MIITAKGRNLLVNAWGVAHNSGTMELRKADESLIATVTFNATAFDTAPATATGVITAGAIVDGTVVLSDTIDHATIKDSATDEIVELTVSTIVAGTGEVQLSAVAVTIGEVISITDGVYTQPAT